MKVFTPKRKMYRKDTHAKQKHYALLFILFVAVCVIGANYVNTVKVIDQVSASEVKQPQELSVKDYVLNEVRKAGIDEYKIWAMVECESRWSPSAYFVNKDKSVDRGLFMFSSKYHPEISNECSWDYKCSTHEAIKLIKKQGFQPWVCAKQLGL